MGKRDSPGKGEESRTVYFLESPLKVDPGYVERENPARVDM